MKEQNIDNKTTLPLFDEEWEDFVMRSEQIEAFENQVSFFDSPEERERKEKYTLGLNEITEINSHITESEELPFEVTDSEIIDNYPSAFDDAETYEQKYNFVKSYVANHLLISKENRKLIQSDEVSYHSMKDINPELKRGLASNEKPIRSNSHLVITEELPTFTAGPFSYENDELLHKNSDGNYLEMGNFWIKIIEEKVYVTEEVNEQNSVIAKYEHVKWKTKILCMGRWFDAEVCVKTLLTDTEFLKITHDRGYLEPETVVKKLYRKYVNTLIKQNDYEIKEIYSSTGWTRLKDKTWAYLTDKGVIGKPNLQIFSNAPYHFEYAENMCGSKEMFDDFMRLKNLCIKSKENSVFLTYYTIVASLTTIYQEVGHGVNFVVALIGATNSQKTSTALIFSRFFDRSNKATPDIRFNSTEVAIMETMEMYGDAILLVDDFLPYQDKKMAAEQLKKSETIIRSYGDRVPRKRSKAYSKMNGISEYSRIKGCCLITGEVFDTNSESSATRVVQLNFEPGGVDLQLLSYFQNKLYNVPTFLYDFICFAQDNISLVMRIIKEEVLAVRSNKLLSIKTPRFRDTYGIMSAAVKLIAQYAKEKGFMAETQITDMIEEELYLIEQVISMNDINVKVKSPTSTICYSLKRALMDGMLNVIDAESAKNMKDFSGTVVDYGDFWCVLPEVLHNSYISLCKFTRKDIIYTSPKEISAPLKKDHILLKKEECGKPRFSHKINSKSNARFLHLKKDVFKKMCELYEEI